LSLSSWCWDLPSDLSPCAGQRKASVTTRHGEGALPIPGVLACARMIHIRPASKADEVALGRYGAALMRQHHASDPRRFIQTDRPEEGYGRFLVSQVGNPNYLVLVAERADEIVGYVFAGIEGTSWRDLRGPCGFIHDVYVDESARREGTGQSLLRAAIEWVHSRGMTQVVLWSKSGNDSAQHLFAKLGFRDTMVEMTLDGKAES
jgi:ribosomal protein S18 acetylase RimI-like enzyme